MGVRDPTLPALPHPDVRPIAFLLRRWSRCWPDDFMLALYGIREIQRRVRQMAPPVPRGLDWLARYVYFGVVFEFSYGRGDGAERLIFHKLGIGSPVHPGGSPLHIGFIAVAMGESSDDLFPGPAAALAVLVARQMSRAQHRLQAALALQAFGRHASKAIAEPALAPRTYAAPPPLLPASFLRAHVPRAASEQSRPVIRPIQLKKRKQPMTITCNLALQRRLGARPIHSTIVTALAGAPADGGLAANCAASPAGEAYGTDRRGTTHGAKGFLFAADDRIDRIFSSRADTDHRRKCQRLIEAAVGSARYAPTPAALH